MKTIYDIELHNEQYIVEVICANCKQHRFYAIPKGTAVIDELSAKLCDKCGCNVIDESIRRGAAKKKRKEDEDESKI